MTHCHSLGLVKEYLKILIVRFQK